MMKQMCLWIFCFFIMPAWAATPLYDFDSATQQQAFNQLTNELRCVVCQGQNLAESNAPLAQDIKQQIYTMLKANTETAVIRDYMVDRYGDSVLYKPPLQRNTYILWSLPFLLLLVMMIAFPLWLRRHNKGELS